MELMVVIVVFVTMSVMSQRMETHCNIARLVEVQYWAFRNLKLTRRRVMCSNNSNSGSFYCIFPVKVVKLQCKYHYPALHTKKGLDNCLKVTYFKILPILKNAFVSTTLIQCL